VIIMYEELKNHVLGLLAKGTRLDGRKPLEYRQPIEVKKGYVPSADGSAYVRIEFHEDVEKSRFWGMAHRDHRTMRILSNPIWFMCEKETGDAN